MSKPAEFCKIILDKDGHITQTICQGLKFDTKWLKGAHQTLGFMQGDKLLGGLIYHDIRPHQDLWWTIYTNDKRWCSRRILKAVFGLAFDYFKVRRINLLVNTDNYDCITLVERLGFTREGLLRSFREDGADCYIYGMLNNENKWKGNNNE